MTENAPVRAYCPLALLAIAALYFVGGYIGLAAPYHGSSVTLIWPPTGIAFCALMLLGLRAWPGIAIGAFLVNLTTGVPLETVAGITVGNTLGGVIGYLLARPFLPRPYLAHPRDMILFLAAAACIGPAVSAASGASVLSLTLTQDWQGFPDIFIGWWVGDAMGVLILAPLLLGGMDIEFRRRPPQWYLEAALLLVGAIIATLFVHSVSLLPSRDDFFLLINLPFALWGALRFGIFGAALINLNVAALTIAFLTTGDSFFAGQDLQQSLLDFYVFLAIATTSTLFAGAFAEAYLPVGRRLDDPEKTVAPLTRSSLGRFFVHLIVGALGLVATALACFIVRGHIVEDHFVTLDRTATDYRQHILHRFETAQMPLQMMRAMYEQDGQLIDEELAYIRSHMAEGIPAPQLIYWVPRVLHRERAAFEEAMAAKTGSAFVIHDGLVLGAAPARPMYFPLLEDLPLKGGETPAGFDVGNDPALLENLLRAGERGAVTLAVDAGAGTATLTLPVIDRVSGRGETRGFAVAQFALEALLLPDAVRQAVQRRADIRLILLDETISHQQQLLLALNAGLPSRDADQARGRMADWGRFQRIDLAGRKLALGVSEGYPGLGLTFWAVLFIGTMSTGLLILFLLGRSRRDRHVAELIESRTHELREANWTAEAAREDAERALEKAREANRAKGDFLAHMSHELRSPLNAILGYTELIRSEAYGPLGSKQYSVFVSNIVDAGKHLMDLIGDILDLSKIEEGKLTINPHPFDVVDLLDEVEGLVSLRARERNNTLQVSYPESLQPWLEGDSIRLKQVLMNFLSNAVKFTRDGRISLDLTTEWESNDKYRLRFSVRDTGIGIAEANQTTLFDAFAQADTSTTKEYGGTGLGLAICRHLIKAMDGEIGVKSVEGEGSDFWFRVTLPKAQAHNIPRAAPSSQETPELEILVVEDIEINLLMVMKLLEAQGHRVSSAANGGEAVVKVTENDYDVVLMDIHMPGMDGIEATRRIRALDSPRAKTPIIALTADVTREHVRAYLEAGMNDVASKPLNLPVLKSKLAALHLVSEEAAGADEDVAVPLDEPVMPAAEDQPGLELVDRAQFEETTAVLADAVPMFEEMSADTLLKARTAVEKQDLPGLVLQSHSLKGTAAGLGLTALTEAARTLEMMCREAEGKAMPEEAVAQLDKVAGLVERTLEAIRISDDM